MSALKLKRSDAIADVNGTATGVVVSMEAFLKAETEKRQRENAAVAARYDLKKLFASAKPLPLAKPDDDD